MNDRYLPSATLPPTSPYTPTVIHAAQPGGFPGGGGYPTGGYPPPSARGDGDEPSLRDLWHLLVRNRWIVAGAMALGLGGATAYVLRATPIYQASTTVRIDEKRSNIPVLDVIKDMGTGSELATEMEVLRSRSLAETVVDSLHLQVAVAQPHSAQRDELLTVRRIERSAPRAEYVLERAGPRFILVGSGRSYAAGESIPLRGAEIVLTPGARSVGRLVVRIAPFQIAVREFGKVLTVTRPSRDANVVVVRYQGTDPALVADVPNVLARNFILGRGSFTKTEARSTVQFLRQQIDTLSRQLAESEDSLRVFREGAGVVSLTDEASTQVQRLAALQGERAGIDAERSALSALVAQVSAAAAVARVEDPSPYRRLLAFPTLLRNPAISQLLASLTQMENQRAELLVRRTVRDPDVITLTARVREMEEQIRELATTYLLGLTTQVASIDAQLGQFATQLQQVPEKEVAFARLARRPKVLEDVYTMLQARLKEAEIVQAVEDPSVRVVDVAMIPDSPIRPNKPLVVLMGGMLGSMAGIGGAFLRRSLDRKVRSRDDVLRITGLPVLGIIPRIDSALQAGGITGGVLKRLALATGSGTSAGGAMVPTHGRVGRIGGDAAPAFASRLVTGNDPRNPISEAYRTLRTNIAFARVEGAPRTLVFTSPMPGDGKTTSASNLAITLAQQGRRVLLVDADLRRGLMHTVFHVTATPGLSNVIVGGIDAAAAIRRIPLGGDCHIDFLPTGTLPPNPAELLASERMQALLEQLELGYDVVILDTPPLNVVTDAALLGTRVDGVLVVTRAGITDVPDLEYAMIQLANVRAPVLGMVLNDVTSDAQHGYGYYHRYYAAESA